MSDPMARAKPPSVLIVEDSQLVASSIRRFLERKGFTIGWAPDAGQGLTMIGVRTYDLILLDDGLPGITGLQAIQLFKDVSSAAIILMTGMPNDDTKKDALLLGATAFVGKPLDLDELERRIRAIVRP